MTYDTAFRIGSGGMGEVFKAWDPDLERFVALKYLLHDDPVTIERLLREARAQARVDHPSVCKVYEVGDDDGRPFIAMEYVEGETLDRAARDLSIEQKTLLIRDIAEAVQAAHSVGLIHRDLKPANILVGDHEGQHRPYVLDFGIARIEEMAGLTMTGQVVGTPGYLSPEQACGKTQKIDRRTDIFSLGVILYELLGGVSPFDADSKVEMLIRLLEEDPTPLRRLAPHVPRDLNTIVMTCLEKDPDRRYSSARALVEDLDCFLHGEPVAARRTGFIARIHIKARKNPRTAIAALFALLTILASAGIALREHRASTRRAAVAQRLGREVEKIDSMLEKAFLLPLHDIRPTRKRVLERMDFIDQRLRLHDPVSEALVDAAIGRAYLALHQAERAEERLEKAWRRGDHSGEVSTALGLSLAELYREAIDNASGIRNPESHAAAVARADREYRIRAQGFLEKAGDSTEHAAYLAAILGFLSGDREGALKELAKLREEDRYYYPGDLLEGTIYRQIFEEVSRSGDSRQADDAFSKAEEAFQRAARIGESDPRPYAQLCGLRVAALRNQFWQSGNNLEKTRDSALSACNEALTADPDSPAAHLEAGRAYRYWAAHEMYRGYEDSEALTLARENARAVIDSDSGNSAAWILLGVTHRIAASLLGNRGADPKEELLDAVRAYRKAIHICPRDANAFMSLANAFLLLGENARSLGGDSDGFFESATEAATEASRLEPQNVGAQVNLGIAHAQLAISARERGVDSEEHFSGAVTALEKAIELNPDFLTAHFNLGMALLERAQNRIRRGGDPREDLDRSIGLLDAAAGGYPTWAAPQYMKAEAHALYAEYENRLGEDPALHFEEGHRAILVGRKIDPKDAVGLCRSSRIYLVEAERCFRLGLDPSSILNHGLSAIREVLRITPESAEAETRRAEFLLLRVQWSLARGRSPERDLAQAEEAIEKAHSIHLGDAGINVNEAVLWTLRARWLIKSGQNADEALCHGREAVERALKSDPGRASAWAQRAALAKIAGDSESEEFARKKALRLDPGIFLEGD